MSVMDNLFPHEVLRWGPFVLSDTVVASAGLSVFLALASVVCLRIAAAREVLEVIYEFLEGTIERMVSVDARPLVPLVLTQWLFILSANLMGLVPRLSSPTRDLSLAAALAAIAWIASHVFALRREGWSYLRHYAEPNPLLLPFNLIGEVSRTLALALRLFGNMLSTTLIGAVVLYLAAFLVPLPLMLLSVLTGVVQAYIFGVLTLVFSVSALQAATPGNPRGGDPI
jgi:F-type H+-transporting ATPase subunit a